MEHRAKPETPPQNLTDDHRVSELLLRACHDLRTPLRSVLAHAELVAKRGSEQPIPAENLDFIIDGARRVETLVSALSRYAAALQLDAAQFQSLPLAVLLRSVLAKLDKELRENAATVTYGDLPRVTGSPDRLMEVFENLLRNAIHYRGAAAPKIHITGEECGGFWKVAVRDNGAGMHAAYLEKIFQPFERLDSNKSHGAGLGLAICRTIVERHGGTIWAESEEGNGSIFYFTLPI
ncbi:MAG: sensor histidine kinase [Bryobacteraceae bacterium]